MAVFSLTRGYNEMRHRICVGFVGDVLTGTILECFRVEEHFFLVWKKEINTR